jgi:hypothetical protein
MLSFICEGKKWPESIRGWRGGIRVEQGGWTGSVKDVCMHGISQGIPLIL